MFQQHRPNVFQMSLGNIPPHETITIEINYTELLTPTSGVYEFVYPTVVGPRYNGEIVKDEGWISNPYANLEESNLSAPVFDIRVMLSAPIPLQGVSTTSHRTKVQYTSEREAVIQLANNGNSEQKDFILHYKLAGNDMQTGITLYEGDDENFFLYIGQSPERVEPEQIPDREYFFIIDVSGSMQGFPMDISKSLIKELLSGLNPNEKFNVMLFASSSSVYSKKPVSATKKNIKKALNFITSNNTSGGTNMLSAIKKAYSMIDDKSSTSMVILTDGYVTVDKEVFAFIENNLNHANFFPFGIGSSVDRHLIEGIAHCGQAQPFIVTSKSEAAKTAKAFCEYIRSPVLTDVKVAFDGLDVYDLSPVNQPDLFAEKPVVVYGKWRGRPSGNVTLTGVSGAGEYENTIRVSDDNRDPLQSGLKYLWARNKLKHLSDYQSVSHDPELKKEITELGLRYSLLSKFTSFIAIDEESNIVEQDELIIDNTGAAPEPHEWALIIFGAIFLILILHWQSRLSSSPII